MTNRHAEKLNQAWLKLMAGRCAENFATPADYADYVASGQAIAARWRKLAARTRKRARAQCSA